ncbi:hypothetical protein SAMN04487792_0051 [Lactobacillus bombicola]|uniref:Uncharacterized protein n=1 Tax=Lactobacillus bombicola TaxID=1505723 RepID=A0A1I1RBX4_9LACO|nr:hypothetical protein [Lactobacillus bombicola]SFD27890.1 hypothetical protein SAMN04487792_0051 [Lactobacillus bombicola]
MTWASIFNQVYDVPYYDKDDHNESATNIIHFGKKEVMITIK